MSDMRQPHRLALVDYCICDEDATVDPSPNCLFHGDSPSAKLYQVRERLGEILRELEQLQERLK